MGHNRLPCHQSQYDCKGMENPLVVRLSNRQRILHARPYRVM